MLSSFERRPDVGYALANEDAVVGMIRERGKPEHLRADVEQMIKDNELASDAEMIEETRELLDVLPS